jgi:hypothetical protein
MGDELTTKPTIETVLERINQLGQVLGDRFGSMEHNFAELRREFAELRHETNEHFAALESKFDILTQDVMDMRAKIRRVEGRMDRLESKPS